MKSFRTETENILTPEVERDILELGEKIYEYKTGKLPEDKLVANMNRNLDQKKLRRMFKSMDMTASMNYKNYTQAQIERFEKPGFVATSQIFNPFAWVALIKAIKNGEFKRDDDD